MYHWEKTHSSVITLLIANIVWLILIPQNYIDFRSWENRTCRRTLLLNLIQQVRITNDISSKIADPLNLKKFKNCELK